MKTEMKYPYAFDLSQTMTAAFRCFFLFQQVTTPMRNGRETRKRNLVLFEAPPWCTNDEPRSLLLTG
jgi:hypothetical protein